MHRCAGDDRHALEPTLTHETFGSLAQTRRDDLGSDAEEKQVRGRVADHAAELGMRFPTVAQYSFEMATQAPAHRRGEAQITDGR